MKTRSRCEAFCDKGGAHGALRVGAEKKEMEEKVKQVVQASFSTQKRNAQESRIKRVKSRVASEDIDGPCTLVHSLQLTLALVFQSFSCLVSQATRPQGHKARGMASHKGRKVT